MHSHQKLRIETAKMDSTILSKNVNVKISDKNYCLSLKGSTEKKKTNQWAGREGQTVKNGSFHFEVNVS